ncbi:MAG: hypothetical protein MJZ74_06190 [Muribaculaceae bacterium]|nr:hypothetical protein [Muribaculaceae bacterium]
MKRVFFALITLLAVSMVCSYVPETASMSQATAAERSTTFYYVCTGSYSSLSNAREHNRTVPSHQEGAIVQVKSKGRTLYRICTACFYNKSAAQSYANYNGGWVFASAPVRVVDNSYGVSLSPR